MTAACVNKSAIVTGVSLATGNDLTAQYTMRYRLASDPDVDASYTYVTTNKTVMGITYPYFDVGSVDTGTYVVHTYFTSSGSGTGTKITVEINCEDDVVAVVLS